MRGSLVAWDPVAGKKVWEVPSKAPNWSGVLSTASGLVFVGTQTGQFKAYDATNGKEVWSFQTGSGITGLADRLGAPGPPVHHRHQRCGHGLRARWPATPSWPTCRPAGRCGPSR